MTVQPVKLIILDLLRATRQTFVVFVKELSEAERMAIGTADLWSAKDHLAHLTFCLHQDIIQRVTAILQQQAVPPSATNIEQENARVFEEHRLHPWEDVHASFEHVYSDLIQLAERLSEANLMDSQRFSAITEDGPLYSVFLDEGYEHPQAHLIQYYLDHHDPSRALQLREQCTNRVMQTEAPAWAKGRFVYRLASFYAQQHQRVQAAARLQEALTFDAGLDEWLKNDPELAAIHNQSA